MADSDNIDQSDLRLRSEAVQEIMGLVPNWMIRWGNSLIFLLIVGVFCMSYFIKYPDTVTTTAVITTQNPVTNHYSPVEGEFEKVLARDSLSVSKGRLLAVIKDYKGTRYDIISSGTGIVYFSDFWEEGTVLHRGDLLFKLVPENYGAYIGKVKISSEQLIKVKKGQLVQISLSRSSSMYMDPIRGSVSKISNAPNEDGFFMVEVKFDDPSLLDYRGILQKPDINATAKIITKDLRLLERFLYRIKDVFK